MNQNLDERMRAALVGLADGVRPQPDPYGRVLRRSRRSRIGWRAGIGAFLAAVLVGVGAYALSPAGPTKPPPAPAKEPFDILNEWAARLANSPTMGTVGKDKAFVDDFARRVAERTRAGGYDRGPTSVRAVKVPFVEDVGAYRYAFVVFVLNEPDPNTKWPHANAWAVAPRGADAATLASPTSITGVGDGLEPYVDEWWPQAEIGLAPAGCTFATAGLPAATDWKPEPTGSYIIRTDPDRAAEWWQVTCDGVVRSQQPSRVPFVNGPLTETQVNRALSQVRGQVDRAKVRSVLSMATSWTSNGAAEMPHVLWAGQLTGTTGFDGYAVVLAAPAVGGGYIGSVEIRFDSPRPDGTIGVGAPFFLSADPINPRSTLAVPLDDKSPDILVITAMEATTVSASRSGQAAEIVPVPVTGGAAVVKVPVDQRDGLTFQVDSGALVPMVGRAELAGTARSAVIFGWDSE